jgi:hypothetical protein
VKFVPEDMLVTAVPFADGAGMAFTATTTQAHSQAYFVTEPLWATARLALIFWATAARDLCRKA